MTRESPVEPFDATHGCSSQAQLRRHVAGRCFDDESKDERKGTGHRPDPPNRNPPLSRPRNGSRRSGQSDCLSTGRAGRATSRFPRCRRSLRASERQTKRTAKASRRKRRVSFAYRIGPDQREREKGSERGKRYRGGTLTRIYERGCVEHHRRDGTRATDRGASCVTKKTTVDLPAARQVTAKRRASNLKSIAAGGLRSRCGWLVVESPMNSIRRGDHPFGRRFHGTPFRARGLSPGTGRIVWRMRAGSGSARDERNQQLSVSRARFATEGVSGLLRRPLRQPSPSSGAATKRMRAACDFT